MEEKSWLHEEIESLRRLRDELRVQIDLAGKEARERFAAAEKRWDELESRARRIGRESKAAAGEVGEAIRRLAHDVKQAFEHVRRAL
jgi:SMC interacting uncharacterized protein involved in chromosome segregation